MSARPRTITINGTKVPLPDKLTPALAKQLAQTIETRLKKIQDESDRVDDYGFAMRLALELAAEVHELRQGEQKESTELLRQLTQLNDTLETELEAFQDE